MSFVVYINYRNRRSRIHCVECALYQNRDMPDDKPSGRWTKPVETFAQAEGEFPPDYRNVGRHLACITG